MVTTTRCSTRSRTSRTRRPGSTTPRDCRSSPRSAGLVRTGPAPRTNIPGGIDVRTRTQLLAIGLVAVLVAAASLLGGVLRDRGGAVAAVSRADAGVAADHVLAGTATT